MYSLFLFVVYCDLVIKNILLIINGIVKIVDLGVVKVFVVGCEMFVICVFGILVYVVLEIYFVMKNFEVVGNVKYGFKVDIFLFGVVLLVMIVGYELVIWLLILIKKGIC